MTLAQLGMLKANGTTRRFTLSQAISGKTTWDLDVDGLLYVEAVTATSLTITPLGGSLLADIYLWGGGAAGHKGDTSGGNVNPGGDSQTVIGGVTYSATGAIAFDGGPQFAYGGVGTNGDVNDTGGTGGHHPSAGGNGKGGQGGGSGGLGGSLGGTNGGDGHAPGGGGGVSGTTAGAPTAGGGGGYMKKTFTIGMITAPFTVAIGAGGLGHIGSNYGGHGADGALRIV